MTSCAGGFEAARARRAGPLSVLPHERYGLDPATSARQNGFAALDHVISFDLAHAAALRRAPGQLVVRLQGVLQVVLVSTSRQLLLRDRNGTRE